MEVSGRLQTDAAAYEPGPHAQALCCPFPAHCFLCGAGRRASWPPLWAFASCDGLRDDSNRSVSANLASGGCVNGRRLFLNPTGRAASVAASAFAAQWQPPDRARRRAARPNYGFTFGSRNFDDHGNVPSTDRFVPSATANWYPRSRVHRDSLNSTGYAACLGNSCSRAQAVTETPSKQKRFLASGTVSIWLLTCRAYPQSSRRPAQLEPQLAAASQSTRA